MEIIPAKTWSEVKAAIAEVRNRYGITKTILDNGAEYVRHNDIFFRGQSDSKWDLLTTLERSSSEEFTVERYMHYATECVHEIESFTNRKWNVKSMPDINQELKAEGGNSFRCHLPHYDFLVYLRHHGFPSPLLDWTESPFIAAFFAYSTARLDTDAAIYCYIERPYGSKGGIGGEPIITLLGPYVSTHRRHFAQKAWYTTSSYLLRSDASHHFCKHNNVFARDNPQQDIVVKIQLPGADKIEALRELDDYNINYFTLFHDEESLVKTMAMRSFEIERKPSIILGPDHDENGDEGSTKNDL